LHANVSFFGETNNAYACMYTEAFVLNSDTSNMI